MLHRQNCLYAASNLEGATQHQSVVLYHMNNPVWYEMVKVSLPIEKYYGAHLRLEYRHCSSTFLGRFFFSSLIYSLIFNRFPIEMK